MNYSKPESSMLPDVLFCAPFPGNLKFKNLSIVPPSYLQSSTE